MCLCVCEWGVETQTGIENVESIHPAYTVIWTDLQRCVGIYRLNHIYCKEEKNAEKHFVMFSTFNLWAVETQSYNINASSGRFFPVLFILFIHVLFIFYHVFWEFDEFVRCFFSPFPISRKYVHIWIMTFLQELTAVCANHAYKSITEAYVL